MEWDCDKYVRKWEIHDDAGPDAPCGAIVRPKWQFEQELAGTMATLGTLLRTMISGELVGTDQYSNKYYRGRSRNRYDRERRWVVYKGRPEASKVPPEWHAWLHHLSEQPLDESQRHDWQKEHVPNLTGTRAAYHPPGSVLRDGERKRGTGDYEPWTPQ